ncbi:MAG: 1-deoxy-D-xylulose-5-phosphate reductoisomerase, partial [Syntrophales bacterium]|nr:1-deoxy-D-xylulose-5-phosphate reductoisomerase [Syntrophales bacterium]
HSAIYQCLRGHRRQDVKRIILTASGGPFLNLTVDELECDTPAQALQHPKWNMWKKITKY